MHFKKYYTGLDILRFFAAFSVMMFHYFFGLTSQSDQLSVSRYGNLGVQLFFIISGFVISQSVANTTTKNFALGRFIRLTPMFWLVCTLTYIFTLLMPNGNPVSIPAYLVSMTMLGDKFGALIGVNRVVDPVYWSLAVEIIFYVGIGTFVYFFKWDKIRYFLWGWLTISAVSFALSIDHNFFMKLLLVRHASYFIFGATLALIFSTSYKKVCARWFDYTLLLVTGIYSSLISYKALPPYFVPNPLDNDLIAWAHPVLFILVIIFIFLSDYLQSKKAILICSIIGGLTYPLYLVHQTVGRTLIYYFEGFYTAEVRGYITMVGIIALSYFFYVQDKKIRTYLRKKLLEIES